MKTSNCELPAEVAELLDLGSVLGQNQAFGLIAGRCSAAQAASLQRLRDDKKYRLVTPHWREFCSRYLKISGTQADLIIRLREEFGAPYFELAQLTRISPETWRAIQPAVKDGAIQLHGEAIQLVPENAQKIAAAVAELRRSASAKRPARQLEMHERLSLLDRRSTAIIAEFEEISRKERSGENWLQFTATLARLRDAIGRLAMENGI